MTASEQFNHQLNSLIDASQEQAEITLEDLLKLFKSYTQLRNEKLEQIEQLALANHELLEKLNKIKNGGKK